MAERKRVEDEVEDEGGGAYFDAPPSKLEVISSGSTLLDCVLGGGYPLGRIVNIVGDKSSGKTLLAIEACSNFLQQHPKGKIFYRETEAAFDMDYASSLGMPVDAIDFGEEDIFTVEDLFEDMQKVLKDMPNDEPGLYIVDSLDALSDRAELDRKMDEGSYNMDKAKRLGQLFRRLNKELSNKRVCMIIISQVRENIGVSFGDKYRRSGGKSLDFYASQILWLAHVGQVKRQINKIQRPIGVHIKANCKKNKVGLPFRQCEFTILFGFGVDDLVSNFKWLEDVGADSEAKSVLKKYDIDSAKYKELLKTFGQNLEDEEYDGIQGEISELTKNKWEEVEKTFAPVRKKY